VRQISLENPRIAPAYEFCYTAGPGLLKSLFEIVFKRFKSVFNSQKVFLKKKIVV
jgi:hypothetical protein